MRKLFVGIAGVALLALIAAPALAAPTIYPQSNAGAPTVGAMVTVGLTITEYVEVAFGSPPAGLVIDNFAWDGEGDPPLCTQVQIPLSLSSNCPVNLRVQEGLGYELHTTLGIPYEHFWMYPGDLGTIGYLASPNCSLAYQVGGNALSNGGENYSLPGAGSEYGNSSNKLFELGEVPTGSGGSTPHGLSIVYDGTAALQARVDTRLNKTYSVGGWDWTDIVAQTGLTFYVWAIVSSP